MAMISTGVMVLGLWRHWGYGIDSFVSEPSVEHAPALFEDRPVESGLLSNVLAWVLNCAFGRTGHVLDPQIL